MRSVALIAAFATMAPARAVADAPVTTTPHARSPSPRVTVTTTHGASEHLSRVQSEALDQPIAHCVERAHAVDPEGLRAVHAAVAVVRLRADGAAETVEISPSNLAHGLSACLATELLAWRQAGRVRPPAFVELAIDLEP